MVNQRSSGKKGDRRAIFGEIVQYLRLDHTYQTQRGGRRSWTQEYLAKRFLDVFDFQNPTQRIIDRYELPGAKGDPDSYCLKLIQDIEQGHKAKLQPGILTALAGALDLSTLERKEFFVAALSDDSQVVAGRNELPRTAILKLLDMLNGISIPAFVTNKYGNLVAANAHIVILLGVSEDIIRTGDTMPCGYNIIRVVFDPIVGFKEMVRDTWDQSAVHNVYFFRRMTLRYRAEDRMKEILDDLLARFPVFVDTWHQVTSGSGVARIERDDLEKYVYRHPRYCSGEDEYGVEPLSYFAATSRSLTTEGELYLVQYVPTSKKTKRVFDRIDEEVGVYVPEDKRVRTFGQWPMTDV